MNPFENLPPISLLRSTFDLPNRWEFVGFGSLLMLSHFVWNATWAEATMLSAFFVFLWPRGSEFLALYGQQRWPNQPSKQQIPIWFGRAFFVLLALCCVRWDLVARHKTDWATIQSGAIAIGAFGVFLLILVGPLMLLLDRVFKPLAKRGSQKFAGALILMTLCGAWWMIVIVTSISSGFAALIWGTPTR